MLIIFNGEKKNIPQAYADDLIRRGLAQKADKSLASPNVDIIKKEKGRPKQVKDGSN